MGTPANPSSYNNTGALGSATNPTTAQGLSRDRENQKFILELPSAGVWVEKTITDGVITPTSAEIIVLPEGGASTDSLTTIVLTSDGTTTLHEGMLLRVKAANSDTVTVVHGTGTNNISTIDGNNIVLDTTWYLELKLINGLWVQQETSAYKTANEAKASAASAQTLASGAYILSGTSSTGASVAAKVVDLAGYVLRAGSSISVTFSNANTVADALTLNVNGTGAKSVYNQAGIISASNTGLFAANQPIEFRYNGVGWVFYDAVKANSEALSSKLNTSMDNVDTSKANVVLQRQSVINGEMATGQTLIPPDDTIPQSNEGDQFMSITFTAKSSSSKIDIDVVAYVSSNDTIGIWGGLFLDSATSAFAVGVCHMGSQGAINPFVINTTIDSPGIGSHTIKLRLGSGNSGSGLTFNGSGSARKMGGKFSSTIRIKEYAA